MKAEARTHPLKNQADPGMGSMGSETGDCLFYGLTQQAGAAYKAGGSDGDMSCSVSDSL